MRGANNLIPIDFTSFASRLVKRQAAWRRWPNDFALPGFSHQIE
jgi:hypothetical protein